MVTDKVKELVLKNLEFKENILFCEHNKLQVCEKCKKRFTGEISPGIIGNISGLTGNITGIECNVKEIIEILTNRPAMLRNLQISGNPQKGEPTKRKRAK